MSSYGQWHARMGKHKPPRLSWVCGTELVLAAEVIRTTRRQVGELEPDLEVEVFTAGQQPERDIWAAALAVPYAGARCVIVHEAGQLKMSARWIQAWLDSRHSLAQAWLILDDSPAEDFPRRTTDDGEVLAPHMEMIKASSLGQMVRCSTPSEDDLVAWIGRQSRAISDENARFLLARTGGDMAAIRDVCVKSEVLAAYGYVIGKPQVSSLCDERAGTEFAEALLAGNKKRAFLAASGIGREEAGAAIGFLASRLDTLESIRCGQEDGVLPRDLATQTGIPAYLITQYGSMARDFGDGRLRKLRALLAEADDAWRGGAREGVPEVIAACWN